MMQFSEPSGYDLILSVVLLATLTKVKRQSFPYPFTSWLTAGNLLFVPVWTELLEIGPEIASFFFVLDAGENHVGVGVAVVGHRAGMTTVKPVEHRADLVFCPFTD